MDISELSQIALQRYFDTLSYIGYSNIIDTKRLLVLVYIEQFLSDPTVIYYINEGDDKIIDRALNCLYGTNCFISFPKCDIGSSLNILPDDFEGPRITEDSDIRNTENNQQRFLDRN